MKYGSSLLLGLALLAYSATMSPAAGELGSGPPAADRGKAAPSTTDKAQARSVLEEAEAQLAEYNRVLAELKTERERLRSARDALERERATGSPGWAAWGGLALLGALLAALGWFLRGRLSRRPPSDLPVPPASAAPLHAGDSTDPAGMALASQLDECRSARADAESALARLQQDLDDMRAAAVAASDEADAIRAYAASDLQHAGYLDLDAELASLADRSALRTALAHAARDSAARPELQGYVRAMTGLRRYLADPEVQDLPHFHAAGLDRLLEPLRAKRSFESLYLSETPRDALLGQWGAFLQFLFRAVLLLDSYWPDADPGLRRRLGVCREAATLVLWQHGIRPHELALPVPRSWIAQRSWAQPALGQRVASALAADPAFRDRVLALGDGESVFCDLARWGYTLMADGGVSDEPSLLIASGSGVGQG